MNNDKVDKFQTLVLKLREEVFGVSHDSEEAPRVLIVLDSEKEMRYFGYGCKACLGTAARLVSNRERLSLHEADGVH